MLSDLIFTHLRTSFIAGIYRLLDVRLIVQLSEWVEATAWQLSHEYKWEGLDGWQCR